MRTGFDPENGEPLLGSWYKKFRKDLYESLPK
jgi:hypothetical protein